MFWFDQAKLELKVGGTYSIVDELDRATGDFVPHYDLDVAAFVGDDKHAINFAAQARIRPDKVNCAAPQVADLRIGIMQNVLAAETLMVFGKPEMNWNTTIRVGDSIQTEARAQQRTVLPCAANDTNPKNEPLFDQRPRALTRPIGCVGGAIATSMDTPDTTVVRTWSLPAKSADGTDFGERTYHLLQVKLKHSFRTWAVVFNTQSKALCTLRQAEWHVDVDSTLPRQRAAVTANGPPSKDPIIEGQPANTHFADPSNTHVKWDGQVTISKK